MRKNWGREPSNASITRCRGLWASLTRPPRGLAREWETGLECVLWGRSEATKNRWQDRYTTVRSVEKHAPEIILLII
ncbi:hypothetical protein Nepgr_004607 [Nepenthes gracilis]|uniref:Uncharacterized protein n=1 Tax=Nepenthes gracilis TaxID=150966 RepID=A0AAD3S1M3_NEPGR|nr:hypothetical protein Nepgr_004607 [Nepenthes gracilis]